ncbi:MAG: phage tail sheath family protein [Gammaproteobacteria bacterium]|nr:phage tail sheath family protein [Gammaproteobacteria bacterium]
MYKTPNVYVEQNSILPEIPTAEIATAVPVFIGYTEKTRLTNKHQSDVIRINSLLEYENIFGTQHLQAAIKVSVDSDEEILETHFFELEYILYYCIKLFFDNAGKYCYIVSVGSYEGSITLNAIKKGLDMVAQQDNITLIASPDATRLSHDDYGSYCQQVLAQCAKQKDRFGVFDVFEPINKEGDAHGFRRAMGASNLKYGAAYYPNLITSYTNNDNNIFVGDISLSDLKFQKPALYNKVKNTLTDRTIVLPPSAAVMGAYIHNDNENGVWNTPANIELISVIGPHVDITEREQENLNIDIVSGKSINVIKSFPRRGTLIWGARTLAGNDNECRYISVRRLFNFIEESIQLATNFAVFEANDLMTWLKLSTIAESFLRDIWEQGALVGDAEQQAFFVNVGLGKTMTQDDVNNGRIIVDIGVAAIRPAEFIALRISHQQEKI